MNRPMGISYFVAISRIAIDMDEDWRGRDSKTLSGA
jgi:hypothetical protein